MNETANNVIDARLQDALGQYFNGVTLRATVGDCAILSAIRKQNGAPVDIYTPSIEAARDDTARTAIGKEFEAFEKLTSNRLQSAERLLTSRAFKKSPSLALLSCPNQVFDDAFETRSIEAKLQIFDEIMDGLAVLHSAGIIHGNMNPDAVRRENEDGALRICDFSFCGGRTTKVTAQPLAFQSRHVINSSQPRLIDDIHAAGMMGYRLLLGPYGAEKVLTGRDEEQDSSTIASAILGEETPAPTAEDLFPEGHPSADQIARLLARMTGRLANASPFSSAEAALKAFRSVVDNPNVGVAANDVGRTSMSQSPDMAMATAAMAPPSNQSGISKATALALFGGFLISTAGAVYYYFQHQDTLGTLRLAIDQNRGLKVELAETKTLVDGIKDASGLMRSAVRALTQARLAGAELASEASGAAFGTAETSFSTALNALNTNDLDAAKAGAEDATANATNALDMVQAARALAHEAQGQAKTAKANATKAGAKDLETFALGSGLEEEASGLFEDGRLENAATSWTKGFDSFEAAFAEVKASAEAAKQAMLTAKEQGSSQSASAGFILGKGLERRADGAFEAQVFADAAKLYAAAKDAYSGAKITDRPTEEPTSQAQSREVTIGDSEPQLAQAIQLCLEKAPISDNSCPRTRPSDEAARAAKLLPFEVDATEVSAGDFAAFVQAVGYVTEAEQKGKIVALTSSGEARFIQGDYTWAQPGGKNTTYKTNPDLPVTIVSMKDAAAYCEWSGGRLPTEAEWETAARGEAQVQFPWGGWAPDAIVWRGAASPNMRLPQPVSAAGGPSSQGHLGLSGNAREWVIADDGAVLKGGSWNTANPADLRIAARLAVPENAPGVDFGFRCARDLEAWN